MTKERVVEILESELECNKRLVGESVPCIRDCNNCEFMYKRGKIGERIEAFPIAIDSLSHDVQLEKIREEMMSLKERPASYMSIYGERYVTLKDVLAVIDKYMNGE